MPHARLFLSRVIYVPEKRQVVAEFSNRFEKVSKRYSFFPKMHFPLKGIPKDEFVALVCRHEPRRLKVDFEGDVAIVFASSFSDLKRLSNMLGSFLGFSQSLVEPERQFLIEKGWNYFDVFSFEGGEPVPMNSFEFPDVSADFLSEPLRETVSELLASNNALAMDTIDRIVCSRLLKIPLLGRDDEKPLGDVFLENVFFMGNAPVPSGAVPRAATPLAVHGKPELDFSGIVAIMGSMPFRNLGPESLNCDCCRPSSPSDKNVLPSSIVRVVFLCEGLYFNSVSRVWANGFHFSRPNKELRERRKREYFYDFFPAGPFSRGEEETLLFADAVSLAKQGYAHIIPGGELNWCCLKREGALSREFCALKSSVLALADSVKVEQNALVASKGLFFASAADSSPGFFYRKSLCEKASSLMSSLLPLLVDERSRFFSKELAVAFESLSGMVLRDFEELVVSSDSSQRSSNGFSRVLLDDSGSLMRVLRRFSELYTLEKPFLPVKATSF